MLETPVQAAEAAGLPSPGEGLAAARAAALNARAWRRERIIALVVVVTPFLALIGAIVLFWDHGIDKLDLSLLVGMYILTMVGITAGYHRLFSHGAYETIRPVRLLLAVLGSMGAQGPVLYWAAIHRRHHAFADRPGDPHSPYLSGTGLLGWLRGAWHSHSGWLFVHQATDWSHYIIDLLRDRALLRIHRLYFLWVLLGMALPAAIGGLATGSWTGAGLGLFWGGLVRLCLCQHTTWSVNSICHLFGSAPYRSHDEARNNLLMALPAFGEGWHNNHHAFPYSAFHGLHWWQVDLTGYLIRTLRLFGLAWNVKVPPRHHLEQARRSA